MFPSLRLPMTGAAWRPGLGPRESEAWLAQEEARYAARLQSIRCKAPAAQPIGFDAKVHGAELPAKEEEEQEDEEMDEDQDFTDDDMGPADRF
mmetsp:Transcript_70971/g.140908  ORF Transcript_70971/g.140908 Transcript_70971/m.140908 type:complete len:93 (-) Transcript_70971:318-596(-)